MIFGSGGCVGGALMALCQRDGIEFKAPRSSQVDLLGYECVRQVGELVEDGDDIIFSAGLTPGKASGFDLAKQNNEMVQNVLMALNGVCVRHVVYISSDAVYSFDESLIDETTPTCPDTIYGISHLFREWLLKEHFNPTKLTILRPCAIYGYLDTHNSYGVMRFVRQAESDAEISLFGNGEELRDHVHHDDVASIINNAIIHKKSGIYNVATGEALSFYDIADFIIQNCRKSVKIKRQPRVIPIRHRHALAQKLISTFPLNRPRTVKTGVMGLLEQKNKADSF